MRSLVSRQVKKHSAAGLTVQYVATVEHVAGKLDETVAALRSLGLELVACFVGCETGVTFTDILAEALGLTGNGSADSGACSPEIHADTHARSRSTQ